MNGRIVCEIPVIKVGPDNSNGAFIRLDDGRILFAFNQDSSIFWKQASTGISAVYSPDGGHSWTQPEKLLFPEQTDAPIAILNPSFIRLRNGELAIFYCRGNAWVNELVPCMRTSPDEGHSWRDERVCVDVSGYFTMLNDRVVRLSSDRLICPLGYHDQYFPQNSGGAYSGVLIRDSRALACFAYSDDDGASWQAARNTVANHIPSSAAGLQEPGIVELGPGMLWGFARTDMGRHYEFFSHDSGVSWTQASPSRFVGPCSPLAIKRIPRNEWLLAVWNPIPAYLTHEMDFGQSIRVRLVYSISRDNGVSWQQPVVLENDLHGEFSHPAIWFAEHGVLLAYGVTRPGRRQRSWIRIRLIPYLEL